MKLFKIIMYTIIAAIAAVIISGSFAGCHSLKKNASKTIAKKDGAGYIYKAGLELDTSRTARITLTELGTHRISTDAYDRETTIEEFEVPHTLRAEDYAHPWLIGDSALSFWRAGHLVKRTTVKEKGVQTVQETLTQKTSDSATTSMGSLKTSAEEKGSTVNRVEESRQQSKEVKKAFKGWVFLVLFVVLILLLLFYVRKILP